jgi:Domain of unknown function DUF29
MSDDLYEDCLVWSERQADLLRRLAAGERVNAEVDWPNVIEEVQDVGLSQLRAVRNLLRRALEHLLKIHGWPSGPVEHWLDEVDTFLADASDAATPSMRSRLDVPVLYQAERIRVGRRTVAGQPPRPLPETCPFTLDDLIAQGEAPPPDVGALLRKLDAAAATSVTHAQPSR